MGVAAEDVECGLADFLLLDECGVPGQDLRVGVVRERFAGVKGVRR